MLARGGHEGQGWGAVAWPLLILFPAGQNATLVAEKAALQGQLQLLEGQLGSLKGRAQELLLQSQQAEEYSSRLQVGDGRLPWPHPVSAHLPPPPAPFELFPAPAPSGCPFLFPSHVCVLPDPSHPVLHSSSPPLPASTRPFS